MLKHAIDFEDLWKGASTKLDSDLRRFWVIAGLIENCELDEVRDLLKHYDPDNKELFLAVHIGCFMVEQQRLVSQEIKMTARRIYTDLAPQTVKLRRELFKEMKSELLELRHGRIVAVDDRKSELAE